MTSARLNPAERVRERLRRWLELTRLSQRDVAPELGKTQPWLAAVLQGKNEVRLRDLDDIATAMRTTAADLVRDESERYLIELTPTELRIVEQLRRRPDSLDAIATLLRVKTPGPPLPPDPDVPKPRFGKPRR